MGNKYGEKEVIEDAFLSPQEKVDQLERYIEQMKEELKQLKKISKQKEKLEHEKKKLISKNIKSHKKHR